MEGCHALQISAEWSINEASTKWVAVSYGSQSHIVSSTSNVGACRPARRFGFRWSRGRNLLRVTTCLDDQDSERLAGHHHHRANRIPCCVGGNSRNLMRYGEGMMKRSQKPLHGHEGAGRGRGPATVGRGIHRSSWDEFIAP
jgi:hypothetical protein